MFASIVIYFNYFKSCMGICVQDVHLFLILKLIKCNIKINYITVLVNRRAIAS
jgi:hypothetical protein